MPYAIPSLHMAWVLLAWWCSQGTSRVSRTVAALFVVFTVFSTLGTGEHYFIDLIVAIPFALFLYAIFCAEVSWRSPRRWAACIAGLLMVLLWFWLLRYETAIFWLSPAVPWLLVVATISGSVMLKRGLGMVAANPLHEADVPRSATLEESQAMR